MKFGKLTEFMSEIFFIKKLAENEAGRLVFFLFYEKVLYGVKARGTHFSFK